MKLELFSSRTLGNCSCHCARREPILRRMLAPPPSQAKRILLACLVWKVDNLRLEEFAQDSSESPKNEPSNRDRDFVQLSVSRRAGFTDLTSSIASRKRFRSGVARAMRHRLRLRDASPAPRLYLYYWLLFTRLS